jgi:hypothetical protein
VSIHRLGFFQREDIGSVVVCVYKEIFVTWITDLGRCSLDFHELGK